MKILSSLVALVALSSCATQKFVEEKHYPLPTSVYLESGICINLKIGERTSTPENFADQVKSFGPRNPTSSRYEVIDCKTKEVLGIAESSITINNFHDGLFYGMRIIESSLDAKNILVTEDMSDASPVRRYILFTRQSDGKYEVFYLAPEYVPHPGPWEFEYLLPTIHLKDKDFDDIPREKIPFSRA